MSKNTVVGFLIFIFAFAIGLNEVIQSTQSKTTASSSSSRKIANIGEMDMSNQKQINWEQELARTLSDSKKSNVKLAEKPTAMDQFYFGTLQGKYNLGFADRKINRIELNSQNEEGLSVTFEKILTDHKDLFDYASQFRSLPEKDGKQIYQWTGKSGTKYSAHINTNEKKQITKVEIEPQKE